MRARTLILSSSPASSASVPNIHVRPSVLKAKAVRAIASVSLTPFSVRRDVSIPLTQPPLLINITHLVIRWSLIDKESHPNYYDTETNLPPVDYFRKGGCYRLAARRLATCQPTITSNVTSEKRTSCRNTSFDRHTSIRCPKASLIMTPLAHS
jgi:hypothetical protein